MRFALQDELQVRAYVRRPERLESDLVDHHRLEIAKGDFNDHDAVEAALADVDLVICAGGNRQASRRHPMMFGLVQAIVRGMRQHDVRRFVYQAGGFSEPPGQSNPWVLQNILRPLAERFVGIGGVLADNEKVMAFLDAEAEDLAWTVTRPGVVRERPSGGIVTVLDRPGPTCRYIDLARFTLDLARTQDHIHAFPFVGYS